MGVKRVAGDRVRDGEWGGDTAPGSADALALAQTLTEALQGVAMRLASGNVADNRAVLLAQSRALMPLAQQAGATRLYLLAEELLDRARDGNCTTFSTPLPEMRTLLHQLILSVQATRNAWLIRR